MSELFENIEKLKDIYYRFWCDICNIEAKSRDQAELNRLAGFIEKFAKGRGFSVKRIPFEKAGDYLIIDINEASEKGYLFAAHTDTVFEKGVFGEVPVTEKDGMLYGPGVTDCKGGIAMGLLVMEALSVSGYKMHNRLLLTSDEEIDTSLSGEEGIKIMKDNAEGFISAFSLEVAKENEILVGRSGIIRYKFTVYGKSAHSGIDYFSGINAVYEASHKIIELQKLSKKGSATYSCNIISAGTAINAVPDKCEFSVDIRFKNKADFAKIRENVERIAGTDYIGGTHTDLSLISLRSEMEKTDANVRLFEKIRKASDELGFEKLVAAESGGGSDAAYIGEIGVPVVCGAGTYGDFCHTVREYAVIESLEKRAKVIAKVITE